MALSITICFRLNDDVYWVSGPLKKLAEISGQQGGLFFHDIRFEAVE